MAQQPTAQPPVHFPVLVPRELSLPTRKLSESASVALAQLMTLKRIGLSLRLSFFLGFPCRNELNVTETNMISQRDLRRSSACADFVALFF